MAKGFKYSDITNNSEFRGFLFSNIMDRIQRFGRSGNSVDMAAFENPIRRGLL